MGGFLERLRQQKEAEERARQAAEAARRAEEEARKQREALLRKKEEEIRETRRAQAKVYFKESGLESLLTDFAKVVKGSTHYFPDQERVWFNVRWDKKLVYMEDADDVGWTYKYEAKSINTMTYHDGTIEFYMRKNILNPTGKIVVPKSKWERNKGVLENALEQSYNNPFKTTFSNKD